MKITNHTPQKIWLDSKACNHDTTPHVWSILLCVPRKINKSCFFFIKTRVVLHLDLPHLLYFLFFSIWYISFFGNKFLSKNYFKTSKKYLLFKNKVIQIFIFSINSIQKNRKNATKSWFSFN